MKPRKYELKQRATLQAETRQRIVEAVFALHRECGPARTTISGIAERAGVERLTVYRHFSDETELFDACSAHFRAEVPPPDPASWVAIRDPAARLRSALLALYDYYDRGEAMIANVARDAVQVPALAPYAKRQMELIRTVRDGLVTGWSVRGAARRRLAAAIGHALRFDTWRSLVRVEALSVAEAADLMVQLVSASADATR